MAEDPLHAYVPRLLLGRGGDGPGHWSAEGTLVIADVSGFTRLTEQLSRAGRAGGEEIVRTISDVFTILLTATADGGDVVKFSGDALVLFYDAPDHAQRACHAALTMQRVLRAVGGIDSSRGRVRLRMSIGVHTGRFAFFLCGGDHLELYVLGPGTTATVAAQASARASEVVISDTTAAALRSAAFGPHRDGGRVLRSVPRLDPVRPPPVAAGDVRPCIAPPLRDRLADDDLDAEHRRAAVAFVHFGGLDDRVARDVDAAFGQVQRLTTATMAALDRSGVLLTATDVGRDGGVLMLTAGAPDTTGDDAAAMLHVTLDVLAADAGLPVRVGVNAGVVFAGAVGAPRRRTWSTMGAATNLAARVAAAAPWGAVLATAEVLAQVPGRFTSTPVPPLRVRGHDAPLDAALVGAPRNPVTVGAADGAVAAAGDRSVPFVGRHDELALVSSAVRELREGHGGVIEIVGDAGIGKSRLVERLHEQAHDLRWLAIRCDAQERTVPYQATARLLRGTLGIPVDAPAAEAGAALRDAVAATAPDLLPWTPCIATALRGDVAPTDASSRIDPRYRRERTHRAVGDLLTAVAVDPSIVVVEDTQHMDDASADLIAALLARVTAAHPWLAVLTRTPAADGLHVGRGYDATVVDLGPLDADAADELAGRLAEDTPVPVHLLPRLVARSAGNPLFLAALIDAQAAGGDELPGSVEAIVAARIDRLDPGDRRALRYLAVLGDRFTVDLLSPTLGRLGVDVDDDRWRRLADLVIRHGHRVAFRAALVREVAYGGLAFRRRRQLHGLVADALRASPERTSAGLAQHLLRAERWDDAWAAARDAAEHARRSGANAVAGELYDLALGAARRLHPPDGDVAATAVCAGEVWEAAGVWSRALAAYTLAATVTHDPVAAVELTLRRARTHEAAGRHPQALRLYRRASTGAHGLPAGPRRAACLAAAHAGYASARLAQDRLDEAVAEASLAVDDAEQAGDDRLLGHALHLLVRAHAARGDEDAAATHRDRALPVFAAIGDLAAQGMVLHDLGDDARRHGRLEEARWLYERSRDARGQAGDVVGAAASANAVGEVLIALDRAGEAQEHLVEALRTWRGARAPLGVAQAARNLGVVALRDGDAVHAVGRLEEAVATAARVGADDLRHRAQLPLAEALLALGRHVEAWEAATEVLDRGDTVLHAAARRLRGEALLRTGGLARARGELRLALEAGADAVEAQLAGRLLEQAGGPPA